MIDEDGTRHQVTRTTAPESNPRWARDDSAITYVREGNLFIVPVDRGDTVVRQLTDVGPKKPDPRLTDGQKYIRDEEEKLLDAVREQKERKKKHEVLHHQHRSASRRASDLWHVHRRGRADQADVDDRVQ